jgi:phospholipase C
MRSPRRFGDPRAITPLRAALLGVACGLIVVAIVVPLELYYLAPHPRAGASPPPGWLPFEEHVQHIVFVVLENHAFDNYFGTYCPTTGPYCPSTGNGIPAGTCIPFDPGNAGGGCIRPYDFTRANWSLPEVLPHDLNDSLRAWNQGAMNGFYPAERSGPVPMGHYNGSTAPIYWDLAQEYALDDNFFSSILSYSLPNHWHIVAGQSPQEIIPHGTGYALGGDFVAEDHAYLNEANRTRSVEDLLLNSSVSWKYYDFPLGSYARAITDTLQFTGGAYSYWNPQAAKAESYNASFASHFVLNTGFYDDARNGTLPAIAWVIPAGQDSDHPPYSSATAQGWLASLVDAVEYSPEWSTTAMFVAWDDYGGFYDHAAPPTFDGQQLGFRVPLLVVSPYVPPGAITGQFGFFESILHLMEARFQLGCITSLDCTAPLPLGMFDFSRPARSPVYFPTSVLNATYPFVANGSGPPVGGFVPPPAYTSFPAGQAPDVD